MPIEIRELVIRAIAQKASEASPPTSGQATLSDDEKTALVEACTRQVLTALRRAGER